MLAHFVNTTNLKLQPSQIKMQIRFLKYHASFTPKTLQSVVKKQIIDGIGVKKLNFENYSGVCFPEILDCCFKIISWFRKIRG